MARTAAVKGIVFRSLTVLLSLGAALVVLEVALQVARFYALSKNDVGAEPIRADDTIVLSLGESTTYGSGVSKDETYSALLGVSLRARDAARRYRVLNLGWPHAISNDIAACLDDALRALRPAIVLVNAGHNDHAFQANYAVRGVRAPGESVFDLSASAGPRLGGPLIVPKLLSSFVSRLAGKRDPWRTKYDRAGRPRIVYRDTDQPVPPDWVATRELEIRRGLKQSLQHMAGACKERGIPFILVGYLNSAANEDLVEDARDLGIPLVDNGVPDGQVRQRLVVAQNRGKVDGFHPNALGHALIRDNILRELEDLGILPK
jgi:lysophospholipase L1-like esterase